MSPSLRVLALPLLVLGMAPGAAAAALVLNEVLYDPAGADADREYLELYNSGAWPVPLEGVAVEAGNGSSPGAWEVQWSGTASDWIEPGGWFVIGAPEAAHAIADLHLQNGPDAVRLVREGLILDRLGWGDIQHGEFFEAAAAPDVAEGTVLARQADGVDTDDNAADFAPASPTPGRRNRLERDLAVTALRPGRPLPVPAGSEVQVAIAIANRGHEAVALSEARLTIDGNFLSLPEPWLAPGAELSITSYARAQEPGRAIVRPHVSLAGDENGLNDRDSLVVSVGASPLALAEIHSRPASGSGEWVELQAQESLDLSGWAIEDAGGTRLVLGAESLAHGQLGLVAADRDSPGLPWSGSWPSLNDRAGEDGSADTLFVLDPDGVVRDVGVFGEGERGLSWIRLALDSMDAAGWTLDLEHAGGTPGAGGVARAIEREPEPGAVRFGAQGDGAWILVPGARAPMEYRVRVLDVAGRVCWQDHGRATDRADRWSRWDGRSANGDRVPQGLYIVQVETQSRTGRRAHTWPMAVGR